MPESMSTADGGYPLAALAERVEANRSKYDATATIPAQPPQPPTGEPLYALSPLPGGVTSR